MQWSSEHTLVAVFAQGAVRGAVNINARSVLASIFLLQSFPAIPLSFPSYCYESCEASCPAAPPHKLLFIMENSRVSTPGYEQQCDSRNWDSSQQCLKEQTEPQVGSGPRSIWGSQAGRCDGVGKDMTKRLLLQGQIDVCGEGQKSLFPYFQNLWTHSLETIGSDWFNKTWSSNSDSWMVCWSWHLFPSLCSVISHLFFFFLT